MANRYSFDVSLYYIGWTVLAIGYAGLLAIEYASYLWWCCWVLDCDITNYIIMLLLDIPLFTDRQIIGRH